MQLKPPRKKRIWKKKESLLKNSNFQKLQQLKLRPLPFLLNKRRKEKEFYLSKKKDTKSKESKGRELRAKKTSMKKSRVRKMKLMLKRNVIWPNLQEERQPMKNLLNRLSYLKLHFRKQ